MQRKMAPKNCAACGIQNPSRKSAEKGIFEASCKILRLAPKQNSVSGHEGFRERSIRSFVPFLEFGAKDASITKKVHSLQDH